MKSDDPIDVLRCRRGCDPIFLQYLCWEEPPHLRICESRREWVKSENPLQPGQNITLYDIGLRCGDCGLQFGRKDVGQAAKDRLDAVLADASHALQDLADQKDTDLLVEFTGGTARLMEEQ